MTDLVIGVLVGSPTWLPTAEGHCKLWYKVRSGPASHSYNLVEAGSGSAHKRPLFDHDKLAASLHSTVSQGSESGLSKHVGYISEGGDLQVAEMTVEEAKEAAVAMPECKGFTFPGEDCGGVVTVHFKDKWDLSGCGWTSFRVNGPAETLDAASLRLDRVKVETGGLAEDATLSLSFTALGQQWRWAPVGGSAEMQLHRVEQEEGDVGCKRGILPLRDARRKTCRDGPAVGVEFKNATGAVIEVCWLDRAGKPRPAGRIPPGGGLAQKTYVGHVWLFLHQSESCSRSCPAEDSDTDSSSSGSRGATSERWVSRRASEGWLGTYETNVNDSVVHITDTLLAELQSANTAGDVTPALRSRGNSSLHKEHPLVRTRPMYEGNVWTCDNCRGEYHGASWHCAPCSFDLCDTCWDQHGELQPDQPELPWEGLSTSAQGRVAWTATGRCAAYVEDHNVQLLEVAEGLSHTDNSHTHSLTSEGTSSEQYMATSLSWAPDGHALAVFRVQEPAKRRRRLHFVESSPTGKVHSRLRDVQRYTKPGDPLPVPKLVIFLRVPSSGWQRVDVAGELFPEPYTDDGLLGLRWTPDSREVCVEYIARDRQLFRVVACERANGAERVVLEERSEDPNTSFVDCTCGKRSWRWLGGGAEVLSMSERDGWCHLYISNWADPGEVRQLTMGQWVVREVLRVDESQVWFLACGCVAGQDPYYLHLCRVSLSGDDLQILTVDANGTHKVDFSPCGGYFVDTWSRADLPPRVQLRCAQDGTVLLDLETADAEALFASGYCPPVQFSSKGRDGVTDIFGVIFSPQERVDAIPVVEEIYAGPPTAHCPKSWDQTLACHTARQLAKEGVAVVILDGMGTNFRGRRFLEVAWRALDDQGLEDRKCWIRAAAAAFPWLDISHGVGIYGGSAGGQGAMRALLDHGDLYQVAVADCGCHDNRLDKIWWNEQWMGPCIDSDWYTRCSNAEQAHLLRDDQQLLLVVGELDDNVDPSSTFRVVGALQRAGKHNFELCVIVGHGHGAADTPYGQECRKRFFVKHLVSRYQG